MEWISMLMLVATQEAAAASDTTTQVVGGGGLVTTLAGVAWLIYKDWRKNGGSTTKDEVKAVIAQLRQDGDLPPRKTATRENVAAELAAEQARDEQFASMIAKAVRKEVIEGMNELWRQRSEAEAKSESELLSGIAMMTEAVKTQTLSNESLAKVLQNSKGGS